ncbi:MAG: LptF/LptG family permease [Alphaproteobacteria bacterium]
MLYYLTSTVHWYICKRLLLWFLICLGGVILVTSLFETIELLRRAVGLHYIKIGTITEMVFLKIPEHTDKLLPFIFFLATIICLWRFNINNEIIAFRSIGLSIKQIITSLSLTGIAIGVFFLIFIHPIEIVMNVRLEHFEERIFKKVIKPLSISLSGIWFQEQQDNKKTIVHAPIVHLNTHTFYQVSFYVFNQEEIYKEHFYAKKVLLKDNFWILYDVWHWNIDNQKNFYKEIEIPTKLSLSQIKDHYTDPSWISFWKMPKFIKTLKMNGLSTTHYELCWHNYIAKIGLMLSMVLLASAFCLRPHKYYHITPLILLGSIIGVVIYSLSNTLYALGLAERIPVILAVWAPVFATAALSLSFILHFEAY